MNNHIPYSEHLKRLPDFIVKYEINLADDLKHCRPNQGMKVDFVYAGDEAQIDGVWIIWPEILDNDGEIILDTTPGAIPNKGYANMWIVNDDLLTYHKKRLEIGMKGQWWRGGRIADVEVVQINLV